MKRSPEELSREIELLKSKIHSLTVAQGRIEREPRHWPRQLVSFPLKVRHHRLPRARHPERHAKVVESTVQEAAK